MDYLFDGIGSATDEKLFGNMDLTEASDFLVSHCHYIPIVRNTRDAINWFYGWNI